MNETDKQVLIGVGALSLGLVVGLWSADDSGDDTRRLIYRAELPPRCLQMLKRTEEELMEEDQVRMEIMERMAGSRP